MIMADRILPDLIGASHTNVALTIGSSLASGGELLAAPAGVWTIAVQTTVG
jgi:hypothetical protein